MVTRHWESLRFGPREGRPFTEPGKLAAVWDQRDHEKVCEAPGGRPRAWGGGLIAKSRLRALPSGSTGTTSRCLTSIKGLR